MQSFYSLAALEDQTRAITHTVGRHSINEPYTQSLLGVFLFVVLFYYFFKKSYYIALAHFYLLSAWNIKNVPLQ